MWLKHYFYSQSVCTVCIALIDVAVHSRYNIMVHCWSWTPEDRPSFMDLTKNIQDLLWKLERASEKRKRLGSRTSEQTETNWLLNQYTHIILTQLWHTVGYIEISTQNNAVKSVKSLITTLFIINDTCVFIMLNLSIHEYVPFKIASTTHDKHKGCTYPWNVLVRTLHWSMTL